MPPEVRVTHIALIRGINVGRARRIGMADLRELVTGLGHTGVRTILNSGNVVCDADRGRSGTLAPAIQAGIATRFGFSPEVIVVTAAQLATVIRDNPLPAAARDPARFLVAFVSDPAALVAARPLLRESWEPERLAFGSAAAYLWCANGVGVSRLLQAFTRATGDAATTRNWSTVLKLAAAAAAERD